MKKRTPTF